MQDPNAAGLVAVAEAGAIPEGQFRKVEVAGRAFVIAHAADTFYAVEDLCSHEDYPLSFGCLDGARIKCSLHGSRFRLRDGQPEEDPADRPIATFRLIEDGGTLWLDPSRATNAESGATR